MPPTPPHMCPDHVILLTTSHEPCSTARDHSTPHAYHTLSHLVTHVTTGTFFFLPTLVVVSSSSSVSRQRHWPPPGISVHSTQPLPRKRSHRGYILGEEGSVPFSPLSAVTVPRLGKLSANRAARPSCKTRQKKNRFLAPRRVVIGSSGTDMRPWAGAATSVPPRHLSGRGQEASYLMTRLSWCRVINRDEERAAHSASYSKIILKKVFSASSLTSQEIMSTIYWW